ncbi:MAG: hypothetical protein NPIRA06_12070 [Nitrospirales bacterium]|nr:MAG: hypothetical protein NPIRA06_12070 [Nitrospirales bacterium]
MVWCGYAAPAKNLPSTSVVPTNAQYMRAPNFKFPIEPAQLPLKSIGDGSDTIPPSEEEA